MRSAIRGAPHGHRAVEDEDRGEKQRGSGDAAGRGRIARERRDAEPDDAGERDRGQVQQSLTCSDGERDDVHHREERHGEPGEEHRRTEAEDGSCPALGHGVTVTRNPVP